jgi:hypothetical protein
VFLAGPHTFSRDIFNKYQTSRESGMRFAKDGKFAPQLKTPPTFDKLTTFNHSSSSELNANACIIVGVR